MGDEDVDLRLMHWMDLGLDQTGVLEYFQYWEERVATHGDSIVAEAMFFVLGPT